MSNRRRAECRVERFVHRRTKGNKWQCQAGGLGSVGGSSEECSWQLSIREHSQQQYTATLSPPEALRLEGRMQPARLTLTRFDADFPLLPWRDSVSSFLQNLSASSSYCPGNEKQKRLKPRWCSLSSKSTFSQAKLQKKESLLSSNDSVYCNLLML